MIKAKCTKGARTHLYQIIPSEFRSALKLLEPKARVRYVLLSLIQIFLAIFEVVALSLLAVTITLSLNNYTVISSQPERSLKLSSIGLNNLSVEEQITALLIGYVVLTIIKTLLSALVTISSLNLLAIQAAQNGFRLNRLLFDRGVKLIRFGKSQENLSGVTGSLDSILIGYLGTVNQMVGDLAAILMVCTALLFFDFETSLLLFFLFALLLAMLHRYVNVVAARLGKKITVGTAKLNRRILDSWLVYRELLLARKVEELIKPTLTERMEIAKSRASLSFLPSLSKYVFEIFLIVSALVVSGVQLWVNGVSEAVSSFVLIAAASARLLPALLRLQSSLLSIRQSVGGGFFARKLLEELSVGEGFEGVVEIDRGDDKEISANLSIQDLSFTYPESIKPALSGISLCIAPGTFTAITGASGSGKSTLVDLILGFLQPTSGSVLISGLEPAIAQRKWPGKIAYVPQDVQIFEGSILENISLTTSGQFKELNLKRCLEHSGLLKDLELFHNGVHTLIGERGLKLSGGQRQRIGIARALYEDPKLLIFDEATSSLDPITEDKIAKSIYRRLSDRAVIVVAHRLSTVMNADTVVYLKEGKIAALGKFEDLKSSEPEFLEQAKLSGL